MSRKNSFNKSFTSFQKIDVSNSKTNYANKSSIQDKNFSFKSNNKINSFANSFSVNSKIIEDSTTNKP